MTDNEIIKALECCTKREYQCCNDGECPLFYKTVTYSECRWELLKGTTDLINRLQAENEELKEENENLKSYISIEFVGEAIGQNLKKKIKAEAIKEFAELLIDEKSYPHPNELNTRIVYVSDIQEMVGDKNE